MDFYDHSRLLSKDPNLVSRVKNHFLRILPDSPSPRNQKEVLDSTSLKLCARLPQQHNAIFSPPESDNQNAPLPPPKRLQSERKLTLLTP